MRIVDVDRVIKGLEHLYYVNGWDIKDVHFSLNDVISNFQWERKPEMNNEFLKEVRFDVWCKDCKYANTTETDDPCNECLADFMNLMSTKPVYFKEVEKV